MPNENHANSNADQERHKKRNVLKPGIKRILWVGLILLVGLLVSTFWLASGRILFFTGSFLSLATLTVIALQSITYSGQWKAMDEGLAIERNKTNPRLRIAEVTAEDFEVGKRPFYVVTIANDGLLAATDVRIHMSIEIGAEKPLDWIDDPIVTIPASGKEHYFIHSSFWLSREQFDSFDNAGVPLRVVGFFEYLPIGITNFCYKYVPTQGEYRPPKVPQFVPCDFTPRLSTTVHIKEGIEAKATVGAVGVVIKKNPTEETRPQEDSEGKREDDKQNPA